MCALLIGTRVQEESSSCQEAFSGEGNLKESEEEEGKSNQNIYLKLKR